MSTQQDAITREQFVERSRFPGLWRNWEQREDGRYYSVGGCTCAGCLAGVSEEELAEDWDRAHAEGYIAAPGGGWAATEELLRRWEEATCS